MNIEVKISRKLNQYKAVKYSVLFIFISILVSVYLKYILVTGSNLGEDIFLIPIIIFGGCSLLSPLPLGFLAVGAACKEYYFPVFIYIMAAIAGVSASYYIGVSILDGA